MIFRLLIKKRLIKFVSTYSKSEIQSLARKEGKVFWHWNDKWAIFWVFCWPHGRDGLHITYLLWRIFFLLSMLKDRIYRSTYMIVYHCMAYLKSPSDSIASPNPKKKIKNCRMGHRIICRWNGLGFGVFIFQSSNWSYWCWSWLVPPLTPSLAIYLVIGIWLILYCQWLHYFSYILLLILCAWCLITWIIYFID